MSVVADSSPLIYLSWLGDLHLIRRVLGPVQIPPAVYREVVLQGEGQPGAAEVMDAKREGWLTVADPLEPDATRRLIEQHGLEIGECEAILLASAIGAEALLVDEQRAVALARRLGLPVVRTTALYVAAKRLGLLETVRPKLDALRAFGFWLSDAGYASVLRAAGEQ